MRTIKPIFFLSLITILLFSGCIGDDVVPDYIEPRVKITNPIDSLKQGDTYQFTADFFNNTGQLESIPVMWESSNDTVISITTGGLAEGLTRYSCNIIAIANYENEMFTDTITVAVGDTTLVSATDSVRTGTAATTSSYVCEGSFTLRDGGSGNLVLEFGPDFQASSSLPGLYVYLTNNPATNAGALEIGPVTQFTGPVSFNVPGGVALYDYDYVLFYCKPFVVKVGDGPFDN